MQQGSRRLHFARTVHSRHPFPAIGDAAYHQHARGGPSRGHGLRVQKIWIKIARTFPEISSRTDRHTYRHTHHSTSQPAQTNSHTQSNTDARALWQSELENCAIASESFYCSSSCLSLKLFFVLFLLWVSSFMCFLCFFS